MTDPPELLERPEAGWCIRLVKTDDVTGPAAIGTVYEAKFSRARATTREDAHVRAYRMLKRDRPSENPMSWTVSA